MLALPPGHPLSGKRRVPAAALADLPLLLAGRGALPARSGTGRRATRPACEPKLANTRAASLATAVQCVTGGLGVTLIPQSAVPVEATQKPPRPGAVRRAPPGTTDRPGVSLVQRSRRVLPAAGRDHRRIDQQSAPGAAGQVGADNPAGRFSPWKRSSPCCMRADSDDEWCARQRGTGRQRAVGAGPARADGQRPRRRGARFADDADDAGPAGRSGGEPVDPAVLRRPDVGGAALCSAAECDQLAAYLVTESVPMPGRRSNPGNRTPGLANIALLRRPADLDEATLAEPVATRPHLGGHRDAVDLRLHPELGGAHAHPGRTGNRRASSKSCSPSEAVTDLQGVLRRRRRRRPAGPDGPDGRQHQRRSAPTRTSTPCPPAATSSKTPFQVEEPT